MNGNTNWWDVLGNNVTAQQAIAQYRAERTNNGETGQWMERTAAALYDGKPPTSWERLAQRSWSVRRQSSSNHQGRASLPTTIVSRAAVNAKWGKYDY